MKPTETTNRALVWRFKDAGITVTFWRDTRNWGGRIEGAAGGRTLPMAMLDTLIIVHRLGDQVLC